MNIAGTHYETIWLDEQNPQQVQVIDQTQLPFRFRTRSLHSSLDVYNAIKGMTVRGAPLIGVTAAFGIYLAALHADPGNWRKEIDKAAEKIGSARPTAVNLVAALEQVVEITHTATSRMEAVEKSLNASLDLLEKERENSRRIGEHGLPFIRAVYEKTSRPVNILTHCNAGWLACIDYGTATAPVYLAHDQGIPVHVWVDETRPRNQGARLTAFELGEHGVPHTVITDNAGGHLMQHGKVDMVLVGSDRTTRGGDVTNKIGTYLKALAASDNRVPFYVALPTSSIDPQLEDGLKQVPIEERHAGEVKNLEGWDPDSQSIRKITLTPPGSPALNPGFDVTPARLITALITECGTCRANPVEIASLLKNA